MEFERRKLRFIEDKILEIGNWLVKEDSNVSE